MFWQVKVVLINIRLLYHNMHFACNCYYDPIIPHLNDIIIYLMSKKDDRIT